MAWPNAVDEWRKETKQKDETVTDEALDAMLENQVRSVTSS